MKEFKEYLEAVSMNSKTIVKADPMNIWLSEGFFVFGKMSDTILGPFEKIKANQIFLFRNVMKGDYIIVFDSKETRKTINRVYNLKDSSKDKSFGNFKLIEILPMSKESLDSIKIKHKITSARSAII